MRKTLIFPMAALASISLLAGCGSNEIDTVSADDKITRVLTLVGDWEQSNIEDVGVRMTASVNDDTIQIWMNSRDSSSLYWMGSFQVSDKNASDSFKLESKADPDAQKRMESSMFGSQDKSKMFEYKNGNISYKFTMLGQTSTIRLSKSSK